MLKAKTFTANTAIELEGVINSWIQKENPEIISTHYHADGVEFIYSVLILYRDHSEVRR